MVEQKLKTPKIGERIVVVSLYYGIGYSGKRLPGASDPAGKLKWVEFDNGQILGVPLSEMWREADYKKSDFYKTIGIKGKNERI